MYWFPCCRNVTVKLVHPVDRDASDILIFEIRQKASDSERENISALDRGHEIQSDAQSDQHKLYFNDVTRCYCSTKRNISTF